MNRKWHIKTRFMITLMGLTCGMLFIVAVAFNLSVRSYVRSRVAAQLERVSSNASEERKGGAHGALDGKHFDDKPDRSIGTRGNALVLDSDFQLLFVMHGDNATAAEIVAYFGSHGITADLQNRIVPTESGTYAVSVVPDPKEDCQYLLVYVDVTSVMSLTDQMNLILVFVILAAVMFSVFLSFRFARSFSGPVRKLAGFAEEIGRGNLETRDLAFRDVEFDELAGAMNHMVKDLKDAKHTQEVFFQNTSHELRTPLTSIRGNAEGIVYGIMEPQAAAKVILSESEKLGNMVEDILFLSRIGKTTTDGTGDPIDLREVLSLCVSEQKAAAGKNEIMFRFDFDEDPVRWSIREQDAQRLFGNLISNAIRYAKSEILLSCHTKDGRAIILVADDGPGVSEEDLPHVFERFYKGRDGQHGIGLAIAQTVAQTYNGTVTVRNNNGAEFEVEFSMK